MPRNRLYLFRHLRAQRSNPDGREELGWLGAVHGHRVRPLGVEHFGQTGTIADLYRHYGIDANAIIAAAQAIAPGRPIRYLGAA